MSDVPEGYKMSEVGVIPEEWEVKTFGEIFKFLSTGSNSRSDLSEYGEIKNIHYGDIHTKWKHFLDCSKDIIPSIDKDKVSNLPLLEDGDLIMADASEDYDGLGISVEVKNIKNQKIVAGLHTLLLRGDKTVVADGFKGYIQSIKAVQDSLKRIATGISVYGISKNNLKSIQIPLPPLPEQQAITSALSDVDALITALEQLITKKRNIKQGAMQQLLTGKKRLPRFSGEWEVKKLGEVGSFSKGKGIRKDEVVSEGLPCIRYGEIYTTHNNYIKSFKSFITQSLANESIEIKTGDLLFAGSGETAEEIGKCVAFVGNERVFAGGDIVILRPSSININSLFLGFLLNNPIVTRQKVRMGQGDAVVHISGKNLSKIQTPLPPTKDEQTAIAQILFDMDTEIESLEQKRNKYKAIKQGMMQELLTGKRRLA